MERRLRSPQLLVVYALIAVNIGVSLWSQRHAPRIAYVRSKDLVYGYFGMKEAMTEFQNKQNTWKANIDTLSQDLRKSVAELKRPDIAPEVRTERQLGAARQQKDLQHYGEAMQTKLAEDEKQMLDGVLGQVNAFVEKYARSKGYDVVLGTTDAGSLLYGNGAMDITDDVLAALNREHEGVAK